MKPKPMKKPSTKLCMKSPSSTPAHTRMERPASAPGASAPSTSLVVAVVEGALPGIRIDMKRSMMYDARKPEKARRTPPRGLLRLVRTLWLDEVRRLVEHEVEGSCEESAAREGVDHNGHGLRVLVAHLGKHRREEDDANDHQVHKDRAPMAAPRPDGREARPRARCPLRRCLSGSEMRSNSVGMCSAKMANVRGRRVDLEDGRMRVGIELERVALVLHGFMVPPAFTASQVSSSVATLLLGFQGRHVRLIQEGMQSSWPDQRNHRQPSLPARSRFCSAWRKRQPTRRHRHGRGHVVVTGAEGNRQRGGNEKTAIMVSVILGTQPVAAAKEYALSTMSCNELSLSTPSALLSVSTHTVRYDVFLHTVFTPH